MKFIGDPEFSHWRDHPKVSHDEQYRAVVLDSAPPCCVGRVLLDDVLPIRFFTDDSAAPSRRSKGYDGLDGQWVCSNYWHRSVGWHDGVWARHGSPAERSECNGRYRGEGPGLSF